MQNMAEDVHIMEVLTAVILLLTLCCTSVAQQSLYQKGDNVVILNSTTLKRTIYDSETAWYVEFYSSWCGHCQRFAPTWKELAADVKEWYTVIRVAAIDCAHDLNTEICREYDITLYPTLTFFHARSPMDTRGIKANRTEPLWHEMLDFVEKQSAENRPQAWPKLHVLQTLDDIWHDVHRHVTHAVLIFEEKDSYIGRAVTLDLSKYPQIVVRRMLKDKVKKYGVQYVPSAYRIDPGGIFHKILEKGERSDFVTALKNLIGVTSADDAAQLLDSDAGVIHMEKNRNISSVHIQDLLSGLHYAFRQEVAGHQTISGDKMGALKSFLTILTKYFPGPPQVNKYLHLLHRKLEEVHHSITGEEWLVMTTAVQTEDGYLPSNIHWTGCHGSKPHLRGYPCSLWTLFHVLTVSAYGKFDKSGQPTEVLRAMRGYIGNFFSCQECRAHFLEMAESMDSEVTDTDSSILWLWRAHNKANKRLAGDVTEDTEHPKIQFPSSDMCRACWKMVNGENVADESIVLSFLRRYYDSKRIVQDISPPSNQDEDVFKIQRKKDFNEWKNRSDNAREIVDAAVMDRLIRTLPPYRAVGEQTTGTENFMWGFNIFDTSICVIFYMFCVLLLVFGYYHFMRKNRSSLRNLFCRKVKAWRPPI